VNIKLVAEHIEAHPHQDYSFPHHPHPKDIPGVLHRPHLNTWRISRSSAPSRRTSTRGPASALSLNLRAGIRCAGRERIMYESSVLSTLALLVNSWEEEESSGHGGSRRRTKGRQKLGMRSFEG